MARQPLHAIGGGGYRRCQRSGLHHHQPAGVRVDAHGVALFEDPADDRGRVLCQVTVDQEEGGVHVMPPEDVEQ